MKIKVIFAPKFINSMKNAAKFILLLAISALIACGTDQRRANRTTIEILDKQAAAVALCTDTIDHFFEHISLLEMSIQMKTDTNALKPNPQQTYANFLQSEAGTFTQKEANCANQQLQKALAYAYKISPDLDLPDTVKLAKIAGNAYGGQTFFTRQNTIFIPEAVLLGGEAEEIYTTLIHELFHLYSRYNPEVKKRLFAAIGFRPLPNLGLNMMLKKRVFYNPDAVDVRYAIGVEDNKGRKFEVVPMIFSRFGAYAAENGLFFQHLEFRLFEISQQNDTFVIIPDHVGYAPEELRNFFPQIGRNTNYIIHPEEILADNFKLIALQKAGLGVATVGIDEGGKALLAKIEKILLENHQ